MLEEGKVAHKLIELVTLLFIVGLSGFMLLDLLQNVRILANLHFEELLDLNNLISLLRFVGRRLLSADPPHIK